MLQGITLVETTAAGTWRIGASSAWASVMLVPRNTQLARRDGWRVLVVNVLRQQGDGEEDKKWGAGSQHWRSGCK